MKRPIITDHAVARYKERTAKEHLSDEEARAQLAQLLDVAPLIECPPWVDTLVASHWMQLSDGIIAACRPDPTSKFRMIVVTVFVRSGVRRQTRTQRNRRRSQQRTDRKYASRMGKRSVKHGRRALLQLEEWS